MTRVVRLFRGNVRSDDVQQYGLEAEPLGRMSEKTAVQPTRVGQSKTVPCREDAEEVARLIGERIPALKGKVVINDIGTVIGSHTGPGTVALFFMGDKRVD